MGTVESVNTILGQDELAGNALILQPISVSNTLIKEEVSRPDAGWWEAGEQGATGRD